MAKRCPANVRCTIDSAHKNRCLTCLRLVNPADVACSRDVAQRFGPVDGGQRLVCTCVPVQDYTGRDVARVGVFLHAADETSVLTAHNQGAWELARLISMRLGHLPAATTSVSAATSVTA